MRLDIYHIWCNLKPGVGDIDFVEGTRKYLEHLREKKQLNGFRITRAKLGLSPPQLRESGARSSSALRNSMRRIFPETVFGRSANSMRRMRLNGDVCCRTKRRIDSAVS